MRYWVAQQEAYYKQGETTLCARDGKIQYLSSIHSSLRQFVHISLDESTLPLKCKPAPNSLIITNIKNTVTFITKIRGLMLQECENRVSCNEYSFYSAASRVDTTCNWLETE